MTSGLDTGPPQQPGAAVNGKPERMRFSVDTWDPAYAMVLDVEDVLGESTARVDLTMELPPGQWRAIDPDPVQALPEALLFVDGVRRIDARIWIEEDAPVGGLAAEASPAMCASYAAGVVCCRGQRAHLVLVAARRGVFAVSPGVTDVVTWAGRYTACRTAASAARPLSVTLAQALQRRLGDVEVQTAIAARSAVASHGVPAGGDLLVVDGPLRGRQHLPRALGYIKSHRTTYLPPDLNPLVGTLSPGQRTPVFLIGTSWDRHTWYLRLPGPAGAPWAGVARIECSADLPPAEVIRLANLSQAALGRFASAEYKDARAPQNLYPIAGLERELRRRLGDPRVLQRALLLTAEASRARLGAQRSGY